MLQLFLCWPENESTVIHANNLETGASCDPRALRSSLIE